MYSILALLAATATTAYGAAAPLPTGGFIPPSTAIATYTGPITPGGEHHTFTGTLTSVVEQIKALNPSFNPDDWEEVREAKASHYNKRALERRWAGEGPENCGLYGYAYEDSGLLLPIFNLAPGNVTAPLNTCVQLTCYSEDDISSAVTWCNGNTSTTYTARILAEFGSDIASQCVQSSNKMKRGTIPIILTGGQEFSTDDFNVIVGQPTGGPTGCDNPIVNNGSPTCKDCTNTQLYTPGPSSVPGKKRQAL